MLIFREGPGANGPDLGAYREASPGLMPACLENGVLRKFWGAGKPFYILNLLLRPEEN